MAINLASQFHPAPKPGKSKRIKDTQEQLGRIRDKVREEVRERSGGICEVRERCKGAPAVQQAHIRGRRVITHRTTAEDLKDACIACHTWMDSTGNGAVYKRKLRNEGA